MFYSHRNLRYYNNIISISRLYVLLYYIQLMYGNNCFAVLRPDSAEINFRRGTR